MTWLVWTVLALIFWFWVAYLVIGLVGGTALVVAENWRRVLLFLFVFPILPMMVGAAIWFLKS